MLKKPFILLVSYQRGQGFANLRALSLPLKFLSSSNSKKEKRKITELEVCVRLFGDTVLGEFKESPRCCFDRK